jgi:hypothetical protein
MSIGHCVSPQKSEGARDSTHTHTLHSRQSVLDHPWSMLYCWELDSKKNAKTTW